MCLISVIIKVMTSPVQRIPYANTTLHVLSAAYDIHWIAARPIIYTGTKNIESLNHDSVFQWQ